jgi:ribonucleotide monophosphatase NagD (HAD superfamily)
VARKLGVPMKKVVVIGDDPKVETQMALRGGATSLAVTTGTTSREQWLAQPPKLRPHQVLNGIGEVLGLL